MESPGANLPGDDGPDRLAKVAAAYNTGPAREALARYTWAQYAERSAGEPVLHGVKMKAALGLELSPREEQLRNRNRVVFETIEKLAREYWSRKLAAGIAD